MTDAPPAAWIRALSRLLPSSYRAEILADLIDERSARMTHGASRITSAGWLGGHILRSAWTSRSRRARTNDRPFGDGAGVAVWWDGVRVDLSQILRSLSHAKSFTAMAVLTFALGMGVNIAVFSVFDKLMFRPFPYANPDGLVQIHTLVLSGPGTSMMAASTFELNFALRDEASSLSGIAWDEARSTIETTPSPGGNPLLLTSVTSNSLDVLGVRVARGRGFDPADSTEGGGDTAVVLTHEAWQSRFDGSDDVFSRTWGQGATRYRVVGVLPPGFFLPSSRFIERRDGLMVERWTSPRNGLLTIAPFARLRDGVSIEAAQTELDAIAHRHAWKDDELRSMAASGQRMITIEPLRSGLSIIVGPYLWLTSSAVWLVLGVACVNLSTLLLMRGRSRQHLGALRAALGASPARMRRLAFLEAAVLCAAGGTVGWLMSAWTGRWILEVLPASLRGFAVTPFDARIVAMSLAAIGGSALLSGGLPAMAARRIDILTVLRGDESGARRRAPLGAGRLFLGIEAAFGVIVVVGAAITVPAFIEFLLKPAGLDVRNLYTVALGRYENDGLAPDARAERIRSVLEVIQTMPHVERASAALVPPYDPPQDRDIWTSQGVRGGAWAIDAGMFQTLGATMRAGREFSAADVAGASPLAIVNEAAARARWPGAVFQAVIGRTIDVVGATRTVIGVAGDIQSIPGTAASPGVFVPITTREARPTGVRLPIVVRMAPGWQIDQELLTARLRERFPQDRVRVESVAAKFAAVFDRPRFLAVLFGVLSGIALLLAAIGVYAVASFETVNRRRELAIRVALGGSARHLRARLGAEILMPVLIGTAVGLVVAELGSRVFQANVAELKRAGLAVLLVAALVNVAATIVAVWRPARRAAGIDQRILRS